LSQGAIIISGTNGKTTTSRMLGSILADSGVVPLRNPSGSNLTRGLASALVQASDVRGRFASGEDAV
jgi:UDP-N-acetylmuramoylalanine-D-glutamate ligase